MVFTKTKTTKNGTKKSTDKDDKDKVFDPNDTSNPEFRPRIGGGMPKQSQFMTTRDGAAEHLALPAHVKAMADAGNALDAHRTYGNSSTLDGVHHISIEDRSRAEAIPVHVANLALQNAMLQSHE